MLQIHIIALGSLKESYWRDALAEYTKRLKPWATISIHELKEESFDAKSNPDVIKKKEAKKINDQLSMINDQFVIVLDEHGKQFSSRAFAQQLNKTTMEQYNTFTFIIGGPLGLDASVIKSANLVLSLSAATLPHQMARVVSLFQSSNEPVIAHTKEW